MYSYSIDTTKAFELVAVCGSNQHKLTRATLTSSCCGDHISIGNVCPACLAAELEEKADLLDQDITLRAVFSSGTITLGSFRVTETKLSDYSCSITAYDALYWATGSTYTPGVSGTPTVAAVLQDVASQMGAQLDTLPSMASSTTVSGELTGYSIREMLGYMAALIGRNVILSRSGKLKLVWFSSGTTVTDYYDSGLNMAGAYYLAHITVKVPVKTTGEDGTVTEETTTLDAGSGTGMGFEITNPFMTQEILNSVWSSIGGRRGHLGTLSIPFGIQSEPGDIISATAVDGTACSFLATSVVLSLDGGCKADISAEGQSATQTGAMFQGAMGRSITRIEAEVGRFEKVVTDELKAQRVLIGNLDGDYSAPLTMNLSAEHYGITCGSNGNIGAFPSGITTTVTLLSGSTDVSASASYTRSLKNCTGSWNSSTRTFTVTGLSADNGSVTITASYQGVSISKVMALSKVYAGENGENGENGSDAVSYSIVLSDSSIKSSFTGNSLSPSSVTASFYKTTGSGSPVAFSGYCKATQTYESGSTTVTNRTGSSWAMTPTALKSGSRLTKILFQLYASSSTIGTLLAQASVTVIMDADALKTQWCAANDTTMIDGGKIYTGSIATESLKAGTLYGMKIEGEQVSISSAAADMTDESDPFNPDYYGSYLKVFDGSNVEMGFTKFRGGYYLSVDDSGITAGADNSNFSPLTFTVEGDLAVEGSIQMGGVSLPVIQRGSVSITPSAANTPTYETVTFPNEFPTVPTVMLTPGTSVPGTAVLGCGVTNVTESGCRIYLTRTNKTATTVFWVAFG